MQNLQLSISKTDLCRYLTKQVNNFFPDSNVVDDEQIYPALSRAIARTAICFSKIGLPYYRSAEGSPFFNHLHGDHYSMFLYLVCNELYRNAQENIASKVFLLNKALFAVDAFYAIELPEHFLFVHPLGTVLGKASYKDYFVVYQGVTIGANQQGVYPAFSEHTVLYSNSSVIGESSTGNNFVLGARSSIVNANIGNDKLVVGNYPSHRVLDNKKDFITNFFVL